jgi:hypothetical protein
MDGPREVLPGDTALVRRLLAATRWHDDGTFGRTAVAGYHASAITLVGEPGLIGMVDASEPPVAFDVAFARERDALVAACPAFHRTDDFAAVLAVARGYQYAIGAPALEVRVEREDAARARHVIDAYRSTVPGVPIRGMSERGVWRFGPSAGYAPPVPTWVR